MIENKNYRIINKIIEVTKISIWSNYSIDSSLKLSYISKKLKIVIKIK